MDDHDRKNLEFLLKATPEVLEQWSQEVTQDDLDYAQELLDAYQIELDERAAVLNATEQSNQDFEQAILAAEARGSNYIELEMHSVH